jgi:thiamine pyrophosphate-dependent acetolactate synthase large subunit-like protein
VKPLEQETNACSGIDPVALVDVLNRRLPPDLPVVSDIGNTMAWLLRYLERTEPYTWHVNLIHGSMGHSIPAALGASLARGAPVLAVLGDASFLMASAELHTASEYDVGVKVIVLNDGGHGMVRKGVATQWPHLDPGYCFQHRVDAAGAAEALGVRSSAVRTIAEFDAAVVSMLGHSGPALIDARIDPNAMPPIGARTGMLAKSFAPGERTHER